MIEHWPWLLTPLTAQTLGGWFALPGVTALMMGLDGRWSAIRITLESQLIGLALILLGTARAWEDVDTSNALAYVFVGGHRGAVRRAARARGLDARPRARAGREPTTWIADTAMSGLPVRDDLVPGRADRARVRRDRRRGPLAAVVEGRVACRVARAGRRGRRRAPVALHLAQPAPYDLTFESRVTRREPPYLLEGDADGELIGVGRWRLFEGQATAVVYEWNVRTSRAWMNRLAPVAGPCSRGTTTS